jgi:hypothetical protein
VSIPQAFTCPILPRWLPVAAGVPSKIERVTIHIQLCVGNGSTCLVMSGGQEIRTPEGFHPCLGSKQAAHHSHTLHGRSHEVSIPRA